MRHNATMSTDMLTLADPQEVAKALARRIRVLRLLQGWTQATLARRAGVTTASYRRFETTGMASLDLLLRVAHALGHLNDLGILFQLPPARSIEELEQRAVQPTRKRGRI